MLTHTRPTKSDKFTSRINYKISYPKTIHSRTCTCGHAHAHAQGSRALKSYTIRFNTLIAIKKNENTLRRLSSSCTRHTLFWDRLEKVHIILILIRDEWDGTYRARRNGRFNYLCVSYPMMVKVTTGLN